MNNVTSRTASEPDNASNLYVNNVIAVTVVIVISDPHLLHHRHNCNDHYDLENLVPGSRSSRGGPVILNVTGSAWWWSVKPSSSVLFVFIRKSIKITIVIIIRIQIVILNVTGSAWWWL